MGDKLRHNMVILGSAMFAWVGGYCIFGSLIPELIILPILFIGVFIWKWPFKESKSKGAFNDERTNKSRTI